MRTLEFITKKRFVEVQKLFKYSAVANESIDNFQSGLSLVLGNHVSGAENSRKDKTLLVVLNETGRFPSGRCLWVGALGDAKAKVVGEPLTS